MTNVDLSALSFQAFERLSVQKDNLLKTLRRTPCLRLKWPVPGIEKRCAKTTWALGRDGVLSL